MKKGRLYEFKPLLHVKQNTKKILAVRVDSNWNAVLRITQVNAGSTTTIHFKLSLQELSYLRQLFDYILRQNLEANPPSEVPLPQRQKQGQT